MDLRRIGATAYLEAMQAAEKLEADTKKDFEARVEESKFEASQALAKLAGARLAESLAAYALKRHKQGKPSIFDLRASGANDDSTEVQLWRIASLWWIIKYRMGIWAFGRWRWTFAHYATSPVSELSPVRAHELGPDYPLRLYVRQR